MVSVVQGSSLYSIHVAKIKKKKKRNNPTHYTLKTVVYALQNNFRYSLTNIKMAFKNDKHCFNSTTNSIQIHLPQLLYFVLILPKYANVKELEIYQ